MYPVKKEVELLEGYVLRRGHRPPPTGRFDAYINMDVRRVLRELERCRDLRRRGMAMSAQCEVDGCENVATHGLDRPCRCQAHAGKRVLDRRGNLRWNDLIYDFKMGRYTLVHPESGQVWDRLVHVPQAERLRAKAAAERARHKGSITTEGAVAEPISRPPPIRGVSTKVEAAEDPSALAYMRTQDATRTFLLDLITMHLKTGWGEGGDDDLSTAVVCRTYAVAVIIEWLTQSTPHWQFPDSDRQDTSHTGFVQSGFGMLQCLNHRLMREVVHTLLDEQNLRACNRRRMCNKLWNHEMVRRCRIHEWCIDLRGYADAIEARALPLPRRRKKKRKRSECGGEEGGGPPPPPARVAAPDASGPHLAELLRPLLAACVQWALQRIKEVLIPACRAASGIGPILEEGPDSGTGCAVSVESIWQLDCAMVRVLYAKTTPWHCLGGVSMRRVLRNRFSRTYMNQLMHALPPALAYSDASVGERCAAIGVGGRCCGRRAHPSLFCHRHKTDANADESSPPHQLVPVFDVYQSLRMAAPRSPVERGRTLSEAEHHMLFFQRDELDRTLTELRWKVPGGRRDGRRAAPSSTTDVLADEH